MNNKEYISATLSRFNIGDTEIDLILLNQGIDAQENVNIGLAKMAMFKEMSLLIPIADLKEGGFSITWNIEAIKLWYSLLAKELGREDILNQSNDSVADFSFMM